VLSNLTLTVRNYLQQIRTSVAPPGLRLIFMLTQAFRPGLRCFAPSALNSSGVSRLPSTPASFAPLCY